ncbi:MAG: hypothetical protein J6C62_09150 [Clostridia bacterium]|nr:hypothetical protein [Clostridia bacterium]
MKEVLLSVNPEWLFLEKTGVKTLELRKTAPNLKTPFTVKLYCTHGKLLYANYPDGPNSKRIQLADYTTKAKYKGFGNQLNGKVIGEFICDDIDRVAVYNDMLYSEKNSQANKLHQLCMSVDLVKKYLGDKNRGFIWHISNLNIYDKPKELSEFYTRCNVPESKCKLCNNCFDREDSHGRHYAVKQLTRPPQSWCYVEG